MTPKRRVVTIPAVLLMLTAAPRVVTGQEVAGSFEQLRVLVKAGDKVRVTDATGRETTGKIADLSPTALALLVDGQRREILEQVGFGIGAGLGLLFASQVASEYDEVGVGEVAAISLLYGALGTAVGVGIDALISREQVIYAAPARAVAAAPGGVKLRPLFTRARRGVVVSIGF
jgi:hypothetical protein